MRQTGGSRTGYYPFFLDICCANDLATAFVGLSDFWAGSGFEDNMLVASGQAKTFTEYDRYGLPITTYEMEAEKYIYRVYKYEL